MAVGTLGVTVALYVVIPKGFFPVQDTGLIQGISEATESISYAAMADRQVALADAILKDPDVDSLSSFIGVDGGNVTLNSGRFLINLKPRDDRSLSATQIIRRLQGEIAGVSGITLYMQPVQDLTLDDTISRTQYQFILEDANPDELSTWAPKLVDRLVQTCPNWRMSPATRRITGSPPISISIATARGGSVSPSARSTTRSTTRSASASCRRSSPSRTSTA